MIASDIVVIVYSRGRQECLSRLLDDLCEAYAPALRAAGLSCCVCIYGQGYPQDYLDEIGARFARAIEVGELLFIAADVRHGTIGEVAHAAFRRVNATVSYRLAMLMDDDSVYRDHAVVNRNLQRAAANFIGRGHRAYSIKLGPGDILSYEPFLDHRSPIMPFREKMLWVSREVVAEVVATARFADLSIGEDAVISAVAWLGDPDACFGVHGMGAFRHLSYEGADERVPEEPCGGYAGLMNYAPGPAGASGTKYDEALRNGVTPHHVMPDVFVPESHEHYEFNGVSGRLVADLISRGRLSTDRAIEPAAEAEKRPDPRGVRPMS